jgi:hypothetical protein
MDCFFVWGLPDIASCKLSFILKNYFGALVVDVFRARFGDRQFNSGCAKILLDRSNAIDLNYFQLSPFCQTKLDCNLGTLINLKRWRKSPLTCDMISDDEKKEDIFGNDKILDTSCSDIAKSDEILLGDFNVSDKNLNICTQTHGMGIFDLKCTGYDCKSEEISLFGFGNHGENFVICKQPVIDIVAADDIPRLAWVLSKKDIWREVLIVEESDDEYFIHYRGFHQDYDEWIEKDSTRIQTQKPEE